MRFPWVLLIVACLGGAGCNSTGKKPPTSKTSLPKDKGNNNTPFWAEGGSPPSDKRGDAMENPAPKMEFSGILAGRVVDSSEQPLRRVLINITEANAPAGGAPKGVEGDDQGFFMIKGLKPGVTYFLTFRAEDQGRVYGGSAMQQPPNTRMHIRLTEGNVTSITPPPAAPPGATGPFAPKDKEPIKMGEPAPPKSTPDTKLEPVPTPKDTAPPMGKDPILDGADESWAPGKTPPASRSYPPPPPSRNTGNGNIARDPMRNWPPSASIPSFPQDPPTSNPRNIEPLPTPAPKNFDAPPPPSSSMSAEPTRVAPTIEPAGAIVTPRGTTRPRADFTVYDLSGRPWNFRNHSGNLILLDFWSTTCGPCISAIPRLVDLQARYAVDGLEVLGITCEEPARFADQVAAIERVKNRFKDSRYPINYRLYLEGTGFEGRVQKQFRVDRYPTLILLDAYGKELWRSDRRETTSLEDAIRYNLRR